MLWWNKYENKIRLIDAMKVQLKEPTTLETAMEEYKKECQGQPHHYWVTGQFAAISKDIKGNRRLDTLTVGEFKNEDKDRKGAIQRLIRFAETGDINAKSGKYGNGVGGNGTGNKDSGKFSFRPMPTADILKLIPLSEPKGKFGVLKLQVQEFVDSLPKGQSTTIDQPKNAHPKTIRVILSEVNQLLEKSRKNWALYHNPLHEVFILTPKTNSKGA